VCLLLVTSPYIFLCLLIVDAFGGGGGGRSFCMEEGVVGSGGCGVGVVASVVLLCSGCGDDAVMYEDES